jgi:alkane 1-monooxygenase
MGFLAIYGLSVGGIWSFSFVFFTFVMVPILELGLTPDASNLPKSLFLKRKEHFFPDGLLFLALPLQYTLIFIYLNHLDQYDLVSWIGATLSLGVACGAYGINVAHELGHRASEYHKTASKGLLLTSVYMHFFIEHNRGHHRNVSTPHDPASARLGESVYRFWWRSITGGFKSAWHLEKKRLNRKNQSEWNTKNQMIRFLTLEIAFVSLIFWNWGGLAVASFLLCALLGILLLETVNYIEHYGLQRKEKKPGRYEPVLPIHSWNSDHPIGRVILFELSRHSDHHANPRRPYSILRHHEHSLQLPTGYPGMILFSLLPFIFIPYMDSYIQKEHQRLEQKSLLVAS